MSAPFIHVSRDSLLSIHESKEILAWSHLPTVKSCANASSRSTIARNASLMQLSTGGPLITTRHFKSCRTAATVVGLSGSPTCCRIRSRIWSVALSSKGAWRSSGRLKIDPRRAPGLPEPRSETESTFERRALMVVPFCAGFSSCSPGDGHLAPIATSRRRSK